MAGGITEWQKQDSTGPSRLWVQPPSRVLKLRGPGPWCCAIQYVLEHHQMQGAAPCQSFGQQGGTAQPAGDWRGLGNNPGSPLRSRNSATGARGKGMRWGSEAAGICAQHAELSQPHQICHPPLTHLLDKHHLDQHARRFCLSSQPLPSFVNSLP